MNQKCLLGFQAKLSNKFHNGLEDHAAKAFCHTYRFNLTLNFNHDFIHRLNHTAFDLYSFEGTGSPYP